MASSCFLYLLLGAGFCLNAAVADHVKGHVSTGFKPGFPNYYVNAGDEYDQKKTDVSPELPKIDIDGQKELVKPFEEPKIKGDHTPEIVEEEKTKVEIDKKDPVIVDKEVKDQEDVVEDGIVPIIPDGTKVPEEVDEKKEVVPEVIDDDMPKDPEYMTPQVPDDKMDPEYGPKPEIPKESMDGVYPEYPIPPMVGGPPPKPIPRDITLYELCRRLGLRRFLYLVRRSGLGNLFLRPGSYRILAPTDEALLRLPYPVKARLLSDPAYLRRVLLYHMMDGGQPMPDKTYRYVKTKSPGLGVHMDYYGGQMCVNGVPLSHPPIRVSNGEMYVIDNVIRPLPVGTLAQGLQSAGIFTRLYVLAIEAGILEKELAGEGPYTLFAPTDAAFKMLPKEILEWLSWDNEALKDLLLKHMAKGVVYSMAVAPGKTIKVSTLGGSDVVIRNFGGEMTVNDVSVVRADLPATNGVMHAIDEVMFTSGLQPRKRPASLLAGRRRIYPTTQ